MAAKSAVQTFKKYTVQPQGIWAKFTDIFAVDSKRSSGIPLNSQFRNPPPGANDPRDYDDPVTIPAGDIADNPYWKRDVRRSYPRLSTVNQADVVGLLTVGSAAAPKENVLQIGDAGQQQLVELKEEGQKTGLATYFQKDQESLAGVLDAQGLPPRPLDLGQNFPHSKGGKKFELLEKEKQSYPSQYPCRSFV